MKFNSYEEIKEQASNLKKGKLNLYDGLFLDIANGNLDKSELRELKNRITVKDFYMTVQKYLNSETLPQILEFNIAEYFIMESLGIDEARDLFKASNFLDDLDLEDFINEIKKIEMLDYEDIRLTATAGQDLIEFKYNQYQDLSSLRNTPFEKLKVSNTEKIDWWLNEGKKEKTLEFHMNRHGMLHTPERVKKINGKACINDCEPDGWGTLPVMRGICLTCDSVGVESRERVKKIPNASYSYLEQTLTEYIPNPDDKMDYDPYYKHEGGDWNSYDGFILLNSKLKKVKEFKSKKEMMNFIDSLD